MWLWTSNLEEKRVKLTDPVHTQQTINPEATQLCCTQYLPTLDHFLSPQTGEVLIPMKEFYSTGFGHLLYVYAVWGKFILIYKRINM